MADELAHNARASILALLRDAPPAGMPAAAIHASLVDRGLLVSRETTARWLGQLRRDETIELGEFGRWRITRQRPVHRGRGAHALAA
jgi:hypothetical protein